MKKRYTEEQIITAIKEHEAGAKVDDICSSLSILSGPFYNWRSKYARLEVNDAKRLRDLVSENGNLQKFWQRSCSRMKPWRMCWQKSGRARGQKSRCYANDKNRSFE